MFKQIWGGCSQGRSSFHKGDWRQGARIDSCPTVDSSHTTPYWNDDPRSCWLGPTNLGYALIDGNEMRVLVDTGVRMNTVTPAYVKERGLPVCPLVQLAGNPKSLPIQGIGGTRTEAIGYIVFHVRVEGIPSYGEDQVALVVPDNTPFGKKVPVILGTPTINRLVRSMKESEYETAPQEWQNARIGYEAVNYFTLHRADYKPEEGYPTNNGLDSTDLDEKVFLNKKFGVPAFGTAVVHGRTEKTMMLGSKLRVMTQAPYPEDEAKLPNGLHVLQVYTELKNGSRNVTLVVRNGTSREIFVSVDRQIGRVVAANAVPEASYSPELIQKLVQEDGEE